MPSPAALLVTLTTDDLRALVREAVREEMRGAAPGPELPLDTAQAAELAGVQPKAIRRWAASGRLVATRRGRSLRITREDLARAMAGDADREEVTALLSTLPRAV